jgi:hypothetical protein
MCHCEWITSVYAPGWGYALFGLAPVCPELEKGNMKAFTITLTVIASETVYAELQQDAVNEGYQDISSYLESQLADEFDDVGLVIESCVAEQVQFAIQT